MLILDLKRIEDLLLEDFLLNLTRESLSCRENWTANIGALSHSVLKVLSHRIF